MSPTRSVRRTRRRRADAASARTPRRAAAETRQSLPARRDSRGLLDRILDTPHLERVVPNLRPELLYAVIQRCGLEDCGELVALATPEQLARIFDLDLWRAAQPGLDERFDADRFGVWLEALMECGAAIAAQKLTQIDVDLVIAGLAQHAIVFDRAAVTPYTTTDGQELPAIQSVPDGPSADIGPYFVVARRTGAWDAIGAVLMSLEEQHHDYFHEVMRGCRALSDSRPEVDGLHDLLVDADQAMFDLECDRERRRDTQGYVSPAQARAFLQSARELLHAYERVAPIDAIARAYFRATDGAESDPDDASTPSTSSSDSTAATDAAATVVDMLLDAGILPQPPRALLQGSADQAQHLEYLRMQMQYALEGDPLAYSTRTAELAFLANTIVAGCSIQDRPFTPVEASDAAAAVCNLGLENWSRVRDAASVVTARSDAASLANDFLVHHDLVGVFQVGWKVLYEDVCMFAAKQLIDVVDRLQCVDGEIQTGLDALRIHMTTHWQAGAPWRAREALDVIAILDTPAWAALLGLIAECPVIHAVLTAPRGTRSVSASAFEFISENRQIASVRQFLESLPDALRQ
jgi:uncharacterized protein DUF6178